MALALMASAGPLAYSLNLHHAPRRRAMLMLGIAVAGGLVTWAGASVGYYYFKQAREERQADIERQERIRTELETARARADALSERESKRAAKYQVTNAKLADAISAGGTMRYALETARNTAIQSGALKTFDAAFDDTEHARTLEKWRGDTAAMLDAELPTARLGASFSGIEGVRVGSRSAYALSRLIACVQALSGYQRDLRSHVELAIP
jgi:hypothetical protein